MAAAPVDFCGERTPGVPRGGVARGDFLLMLGATYLLMPNNYCLIPCEVEFTYRDVVDGLVPTPGAVRVPAPVPGRVLAPTVGRVDAPVPGLVRAVAPVEGLETLAPYYKFGLRTDVVGLGLDPTSVDGFPDDVGALRLTTESPGADAVGLEALGSNPGFLIGVLLGVLNIGFD